MVGLINPEKRKGWVDGQIPVEVRDDICFVCQGSQNVNLMLPRQSVGCFPADPSFRAVFGMTSYRGEKNTHELIRWSGSVWGEGLTAVENFAVLDSFAPEAYLFFRQLL